MNTRQVTYRPGSNAFLVGNNSQILPVTILSAAGGLYKIRFESGGGSCVKRHRLYGTREEAEAAMKAARRSYTGYRSPHI